MNNRNYEDDFIEHFSVANATIGMLYKLANEILRDDGEPAIRELDDDVIQSATSAAHTAVQGMQKAFDDLMVEHQKESIKLSQVK